MEDEQDRPRDEKVLKFKNHNARRLFLLPFKLDPIYVTVFFFSMCYISLCHDSCACHGYMFNVVLSHVLSLAF